MRSGDGVPVDRRFCRLVPTVRENTALVIARW